MTVHVLFLIMELFFKDMTYFIRMFMFYCVTKSTPCFIHNFAITKPRNSCPLWNEFIDINALNTVEQKQ